MRKRLAVVMALALSLCWAQMAWAGPVQDVVDLVKSAVKFYQDKGQEATVAAVADKAGPFVKGDLYIFMGSTEKLVLLAHPVSPHLVGKDLTTIKDVKGKLFFMDFMNIAKDKGSGWTDYYWPKPGQKEASVKATYIMRAPGANVWFGCGVYDMDAQAAAAQAK